MSWLHGARRIIWVRCLHLHTRIANWDLQKVVILDIMHLFLVCGLSLCLAKIIKYRFEKKDVNPKPTFTYF